MPTFTANMTHTHESCAFFNAPAMKKFRDLVKKREEASERHGVKILSAWTSIRNHEILHIVEASSQREVEDYFIETGFAFWNSIEIQQVKQVDDILKGIEESELYFLDLLLECEK